MFSIAVSFEKPEVLRRRKYNLYAVGFLREKLWSGTSTVHPAFQDGFAGFLGLTEGKTGRIAEGFAGLQAVETAHAIYMSSQSHQPVSLLPLD